MADPVKIFSTIKKAFGWGAMDAYKPMDLPTNQSVAKLATEIAALPTPENTFEANPLVAHHNLSAKGLKVSDEVGGIPMPSIAISNANSPIETFGDITLIANPDKIDPAKDPAMYIYGADAFTGRQPRGTRSIDMKLFEEEIKADPNLWQYAEELVDLAERNKYDIREIDETLKILNAGFDMGLTPQNVTNSGVKPPLSMFRTIVENKLGGRLYHGDPDSKFLPEYKGVEDYTDVRLTLEPKEPYDMDGTPLPDGPYTAETVLESMREGQGREDIPSYYPATELNTAGSGGKFRASFLQPFSSLDAVKQNRDLIYRKDIHSPSAFGDETLDEIFNAVQKIRYDLVDDLTTKYKNLSSISAINFIEDLARGFDPNKTSAVMSGNVPKEDLPELMEGIEALRAVMQRAPSEYFEIKPDKVMELSDFDNAIIPPDLANDEEVIRILKDNDISISVYDDYGYPEARRKGLIKEVAEESGNLFSIPIGVGVGYGALQNVGEDDGEGGS
jgi:hypothetical protein